MVLDRSAPPSPGSTAALRSANQQRIVTVIRRWPGDAEDAAEPLTQATLARLTGLAPATVSNIVRDLVAEDLVETEPGSGRRGTVVRLSPRAGLVAGIDFGHSHVSVALGDLAGGLRSESRRRLDHDHPIEEGLGLAATMLADLVAANGERSPLRSIGLGVPAPITDDVVRSAAILPGWVGVNARRAAGAHFGVPVHVENDANLGALAEQRLGAARGHRDAVFVKVSSGVGGGLILGDRMFRGSAGTAGEIGHLTLDEQGPVCRCGSRGCLEAYASTATIQQLLADQLPDASIDDIVAAAREGHVSALRALEDAGLHLGWAAASVVNLLDPGLVVVGGDMARAGDLLLDSVRVGLRRHALDTAATTEVVAGQLDERASLVGAVLLAADTVDLAAPS
ncbi:ROK family transcriptional regulator [Nocardioides panacisoli]|uniref:ROK family transcriptional regulator n=1 Tax=Nocardioides panacisoli TaxID=627624 RepID=UPI001C630FD1|nr:ROK family transcriptional regulator [Nocardioides panacisoli]QYJ05049.1 ROK family transcriptional regulator [Nocardioides panacisoli]